MATMRPSRARPAQLVVDGVGRDPRLVGVDAGRRGKAEAAGHLERPPVPRGLVHPADDQHLDEPGLARPRHDLVAVGVELRHVDVAVGVDQLHHRLFGLSFAYSHFISHLCGPKRDTSGSVGIPRVWPSGRTEVEPA